MLSRALACCAATMLMAGSPMVSHQTLCTGQGARSVPTKQRPDDDCAKACHATCERRQKKP